MFWKERNASFNDRYAFEKTAKGEGEKGFEPPAGENNLYQHPITGNGICGAPGGCAECKQHVDSITSLMSGELFPEGRSAEDHASAMGESIQSLSKANGHWMSNPHGHMPKSPTQHLAGMVDKLKGSLETVQALDPSELGAKTKQKLRGVVSSINTLNGYAGGKTLAQTNFEEDGPLPQL